MIIEQAKGVLAHHGGLTMDVAFDRLRAYARARRLKLTDVARRLVEHDLAPGRGRRHERARRLSRPWTSRSAHLLRDVVERVEGVSGQLTAASSLSLEFCTMSVGDEAQALVVEGDVDGLLLMMGFRSR